jgi:hypothetical protein
VCAANGGAAQAENHRLRCCTPNRWRGYDGRVDLGFDKHLRVNHGDNEFALGRNHINGIESFWSYAKHRLVKFHGMRKSTFHLHLKEKPSSAI